MLTGNQKKLIFIVLVSLCVYLLLSFLSGEQFYIEVVIIITFVRVLFLTFISRDTFVSWEKSSSTVYLSKLFYSFLSFLVYCSLIIFYRDVSLTFLVADFALFTLVLNSAVSYKKINIFKKSLPRKNIVIYGAGTAGIGLYNNLRGEGGSVVFFIDDDSVVRQNTIDSIKVLSLDEFKSNCAISDIDEVIIAMPSLSNEEIISKYDQLDFFDGSVKMLPPLDEILSDRSLFQQLEEISLENFLTRHVRGLDNEIVRGFIEDKIILITGAGGTIGGELARQCAKANAKLIVLLDHSEYGLYEICEELREYSIAPALVSVTKEREVGEVLSKYKPEIVLHAAAYKHVPLCEDNVNSATFNNIIGTKNIIDQSILNDVKDFVLISSDKAVRPTNVMGATKRVCELYCQNVNPKNTKIISVRFGNVLGSSGSVIPKFIKQINMGGPVTVTHPDITRYFMLTSEACELVLQAAANGKGGEVYILDMGEAVKIVDLAKRMIYLSGRKNIEIVFTGLRPGEKLYEELLIDDAVDKTSCDQIMIAKNTVFSVDKLEELISKLVNANDKISVMKEIVPEFIHNPNK